MSHLGRNSRGFSVIIPAYRAARTIGATLDAVAMQTLPPTEVLVLEDGRCDETGALVAEFARRAPFPVSITTRDHNGGVASARNILLQQAHGEFIAFLDADDLWAPAHLAHASAGFAAGADVVFSGTTFIDANGAPLAGRAVPRATHLADMAGEIYRYNFVQCPSTLCLRRRVIEDVGTFDARLSYGEDLDLWLRVLATGARWSFTGHCTCAYRKHAGSAMAQTLASVARMAEFYEKHLENPLVPRRLRERALITNRRHHARMNWRHHPRAAAAALRRLLQLQPWHLGYAAAWVFVTLRARFAADTAGAAPARSADRATPAPTAVAGARSLHETPK